jgi:hypothetical protein
MTRIQLKRIQPPDLLTPKSYPFSWGMRVQSGELLFISGQVSTDFAALRESAAQRSK